MNTPTHIIANTSISIPLKYAFGWDWSTVILFAIAGGILIDVDHLFFFILKHKTVNPKRLILIGKKMRSKMQPGLYVFHSPEFNVALFLISFFSPLVLIIFLSNLTHIILDVIEHYKYHKNFLWIRSWSIIYSLTH